MLHRFSYLQKWTPGGLEGLYLLIVTVFVIEESLLPLHHFPPLVFFVVGPVYVYIDI